MPNMTSNQGIDPFSVEDQFKQYLELVELDPEVMPADQHREVKRAFYGAFGQYYTLMITDAVEMSEEDAFKGFESIEMQVKKFWSDEAEKSS